MRATFFRVRGLSLMLPICSKNLVKFWSTVPTFMVLGSCRNSNLPIQCTKSNKSRNSVGNSPRKFKNQMGYANEPIVFTINILNAWTRKSFKFMFTLKHCLMNVYLPFCLLIVRGHTFVYGSGNSMKHIYVWWLLFYQTHYQIYKPILCLQWFLMNGNICLTFGEVKCMQKFTCSSFLNFFLLRVPVFSNKIATRNLKKGSFFRCLRKRGSLLDNENNHSMVYVSLKNMSRFRGFVNYHYFNVQSLLR